MKVVLDMNLPPLLAESLTGRGISTEHWSFVGRAQASDREVLEWARRNDRVVITHDLDFGAILAATGGDGPSVIQVRVGDVIASSLADEIASALTRFRKELERGALIVLEPGRARARILPLPPPRQAE